MSGTECERCSNCVLAGILRDAQLLSIGAWRAKNPLADGGFHPEVRKLLLSEVRKGGLRPVKVSSGVVVEVNYTPERLEEIRQFLKKRIEEDSVLLKRIEEEML